MTHDFARQRAARANREAKPASPPWLWFLSGLVTGTLGSFLVYLATLAPSPVTELPPSQPDIVALEKSEPAPPVEKPQFDFYTILPESEVIVPDRNRDEPVNEAAPEPPPARTETAKATATATAPVPAPGKPPEAAKPAPAEAQQPSALMLQAGSFRAFADADRRRGSIILMGFPARVETIHMPGGETWYRVQVGPFGAPRALGQARAALESKGITTVEIRRRS